MPNNCVCVCAGLFRDILTCGLREEGRRDWEVDLRYKEESYESIEFNFLTYIIPLYIYIGNRYAFLVKLIKKISSIISIYD